MARDIQEIRSDIVATRERLRATSEAIGWKADLPSRARDVLRETAAVVRQRVSDPARRPAPDDGGPGVADRARDARDAVAGRAEAAGGAVSGAAGAAGEAVSSAAGSARDAIAGAAGSARRSLSTAQREASERMPSREEARRGAARAVRGHPIALAAGVLAAGVVAGMLIPASEAEEEAVAPYAERAGERGAELGREALERGREVASETAEAARESVGEHAGTSS